MSSTFEKLPHEILMIILEYSGDVFTILQAYLGLNQRLNKILIDKRLHLLTDFLCIPARNDYFNSEIFQKVSQQLLSVNTTIDKKQLSHLLQPLISFHIQQKYIQLGQEFQSSFEKFKSVRQKLTNDEMLKLDHELKTRFDSLIDTPITMECVKHIKSLVLTKGARLECDDNELVRFNLTIAVNDRFLLHIDDNKPEASRPINLYLKLFKTVLISNPSLLKNRGYVGNGGAKLGYFLIYNLYRLRQYYNSNFATTLNMECYRATVDLFLFAFQCQKCLSENGHYIQDDMIEMLHAISEIHNDVYISTAQLEILKIVVDEYVIKANELPLDELEYSISRILKNLIENYRSDVIKYIYRHNRFKELLNEPNRIRQVIGFATRNQLGRRFMSTIMDDKSLDLFFSKNHLVFILLDKKERKLLAKAFEMSPSLIHQLDEDGNDPLLYICLNVYGCRHRIIEFLIKMGSDLQRRNFQGQNFMEILQLPRNKKLLQKLNTKLLKLMHS